MDIDLFTHAEMEEKLRLVLSYLRAQFSKYPYDEDKDPTYFWRLIDEFYELDILEELKQYHAWSLDQPDDKKIAYRSRFRTWLKTSLNFKRHPFRQPYWMRRISC